MSKRFTDTEKWDRPWFLGLPPEYKVFWTYLCDKCDRAGVWYVNFSLASFMIGTTIDPERAKQLFSKQIQVLDETRWFIPSFIPFQYGELNPSNRAHTSIIAQHQSLFQGPYKGLTSPLQGAKDKEQDKEKKKTSLGECENPFFNDPAFVAFWKAYPRKVGKGAARKVWTRLKPDAALQERILKAVEAAKRSPDWLREAGQFIPHPSTWLNQERWDDEIVADQRKTEVLL